MPIRKFLADYKFILLLSFVFFATRLFHLTVLPIFTDESIYLYWAKFIETFKSHWFLPITDGKPPLYIWVISLALAATHPASYLIVGRAVTVLFGYLGFLGVYTLTRYLFPGKETQNVSHLACVLYIITPFLFFYDRMVLFDSPLTAVLIWVTYFALNSAEHPTLQHAFLWGLSLGVAFYLKSTAFVYWLLGPVAVYFWAKKTNSPKSHGWKKLLLAVVLALVISEGINQTLRISSAYPAFLAKNSQFQVDPKTLWPNPFVHAAVSLPALISWTMQWMTWPLFFLGVGGTIYLVAKKSTLGTIFLVLWFVPLVGFSIVGQQLFPRYMLVVTPYLLIPGAFFLHELLRDRRPIYQVASILVIVLSVLKVVPFLYFLVSDPVHAPMPQPDRDQYVADHPSGYGLAEVFRIIDDARKNSGEVTVITQGTFGLYPYAFDLRYWDDPAVHILPVWPIHTAGDLPAALPPDQPVFIVFKEFYAVPAGFPVKVVATIPKPEDDKPPIIVAQY